jgi:hypothetical protein
LGSSFILERRRASTGILGESVQAAKHAEPAVPLRCRFS